MSGFITFVNFTLCHKEPSRCLPWLCFVIYEIIIIYKAINYKAIIYKAIIYKDIIIIIY